MSDEIDNSKELLKNIAKDGVVGNWDKEDKGSFC